MILLLLLFLSCYIYISIIVVTILSVFFQIFKIFDWVMGNYRLI